MKYLASYAIGFSLLFAAGVSRAGDDSSKQAESLVRKMIETVGSIDTLKKKGDVEYTYVYERPNGARDVSLERYRFDGELSWAKFTHRDLTGSGVQGELVQGWDGDQAWVTIDGEPTADRKLIDRARFSRKTNFYWFAMMQKLADPGIQYGYEGRRAVDGVDYDVVKISFEDGVGDAQDAYVLYVNPETHLVDQFLFTVMAFDRAKPLLMKVEYKEFDGVMLPVNRRYTPSDWGGAVATDAEWVLETMKDLKFGNGFSDELFAAPKTA